MGSGEKEKALGGGNSNIVPKDEEEEPYQHWGRERNWGGIGLRLHCSALKKALVFHQYKDRVKIQNPQVSIEKSINKPKCNA